MTQVNVELARYNMIEQQIRPWEVLDQRVLDAVAATPREAFVPADWRNMAFADLNIPLDHGQVMMPPKLEARLLQSVAPQPHETVLEVGTGSGYLTALTARLAKHVYSVDLHSDFVERASEKLAAQGIGNVSVEVGDAADGWDQHGPYDVIILTGSVGAIPEVFRDALRSGGRLFAISGDAPVMEARVLTRTGDHQWRDDSLFETELPRLENMEPKAVFEF